MAGGYIKIWRTIREHWVWRDPARLRAWLDLLMMASYQDGHVVRGGRIVPVKRGQVFASQVALARTWGWDRKTVRSFLELLRTDEMVDIVTDTHGPTGFTLVTIRNYEAWQGNAQGDLDTQLPTHGTLSSPLSGQNLGQHDGHSAPHSAGDLTSQNDEADPDSGRAHLDTQRDTLADTHGTASSPPRSPRLRSEEEKKESTLSPPSIDELVVKLGAREAYRHLDVRQAALNCNEWCRTNRKRFSERRLVNWLNRDSTRAPSARTAPTRSGLNEKWNGRTPREVSL